MDDKTIDLTANITTLDEYVQAYSDHITRLDQFILAKKAEIKDLRSKLYDKGVANVEAVSANQLKIEEKEAELNEAIAQRDTLRTQIDDFNTDVEGINARMADNNDTLQRLYQEDDEPAPGDGGGAAAAAGDDEFANNPFAGAAADLEAGKGGFNYNFNKKSHKYKCALSKGKKYYYKRVNNKWKRISNKEGFKMEKSRLKL